MTSAPQTPETGAAPSRTQIKHWRRHLAEERAEGKVYRDLAMRREGEEREILLGLAEAEARHERYWYELLGPHAHPAPRQTLRGAIMPLLARLFGSVFVLALAQRSEQRNDYEIDADASSAMAADERIHSEVVRSLAARHRQRLSGTLRPAIFGVNDGLVSNLSLVLGVGATGISTHAILLTGLTGLLAGALSMAAGEFISVRSQIELLEASTPDPGAGEVVPALDVNANELALIYRARGEDEHEAVAHAKLVLSAANIDPRSARQISHIGDEAPNYEEIGTAKRAALSSFVLFSVGAVIPCLPYLVGLSGMVAVAASALLVGAALCLTGGAVGVLSGKAPLPSAMRQLAIGYGAATITYLLGLAFGTSAS